MVTNGLLLCDMNHFILVIGILEPNASASQARRRDSPVKGFTFAQSVVCTQYSFKKIDNAYAIHSSRFQR